MADFPIWKRIDIDGRPVPFVYPQHRTADGYMETGTDNPLPTGNHVMTEGGIWIPQRGSDDGAVNTQVTGSIVEYAGHDALAITDTNTKNGNGTDVSNLPYKYIHVRNDLDADVEIGVSIYTETPGGNFVDTIGTTLSVTVKAKTKSIITKEDMPLLDTLFYRFTLRAKAKEVPNEGTLSTWLIGGK